MMMLRISQNHLETKKLRKSLIYFLFLFLTESLSFFFELKMYQRSTSLDHTHLCYHLFPQIVEIDCQLCPARDNLRGNDGLLWISRIQWMVAEERGNSHELIERK